MNAHCKKHELNPKLKEALNRALDQSKKGLGATHEEVMKEVRARLKSK